MTTCSSCGQPLARGARFCGACGAKVAPVDAGSDPILGRILNGKYRVLSLIGEGSMGTVYLGEHVGLQKKVALKVLRSELMGGEETITRFQREGIAAGKFSHPNAIQIFDFDRAEDGRIYLAMEFIEGEDLRAFLRRVGRVEVDRALVLTRQVLGALAEAHQQGIVHRDLKPENIMVTAGPEGEQIVKVLDFGLSKLVHFPLGASLATQPGRIMGTPLYMAPEQGVGDPVDHRSDLYAVGLILYELVTGTQPFRSDSVVELISKQISAPVPALTDSHPDLLVPTPLEELVQRSLEKRKEDRFQSAQEMLAALDAIDPAAVDVEGARIRPRRGGPAVSESGKHAQRQQAPARGRSLSRPLVALAALALIALAAALGKGVLGGAAGAPAFPRASMKPLEARTGIEASYVSLLDEARRRLAEGDSNGAMARVGEARAMACADSEADYLRARVWLARGDPDNAARDLEAALGKDQRYGEAAAELAWLELDRGRFERAEELFAELTAMPGGATHAAIGRGEMLLRAGDARAAEQELVRALELDPDLPRAAEALGRARLQLADTAGAREAFAQATRSDPTAWRAFAGLARAQLSEGLDVEAEKSLRTAIDLGSDAAEPLALLATLLLESGRGREALGLLEPRLERRPDWSREQLLLGIVRESQGDPRGALEALGLALRADEAEPAAHLLAGLLRHEGGEGEPAALAYERAIELDERAPLPHLDLGLLRFEQGAYPDAVAGLERSLDLAPANDFARHALGLIQADYAGNAAAAAQHRARLRSLARSVPTGAEAAAEPQAPGHDLQAVIRRQLDGAVARVQARLQLGLELDRDHSRWEDAWVFESEHYSVRATHSRFLAAEMAQGLEQMLVFFRRLLRPDWEPRQRYTVFVFPDIPSYNAYGEQFGDDHSSFYGGFFAGSGPDRAVAAAYDDNRVLLKMQVTHGALHQFLAEACPRPVPLWLDEGLAAYFSFFWDNAWAVGEFRRIASGPAWVPLPQLLGAALPAYRDRTHERFIQLGMLFSYLIDWNERTRGATREGEAIAGTFAEALRRFVDGSDPRPPTLAELIEVEPDAFEAELRAFPFGG